MVEAVRFAWEGDLPDTRPLTPFPDRLSRRRTAFLSYKRRLPGVDRVISYIAGRSLVLSEERGRGRATLVRQMPTEPTPSTLVLGALKDHDGFSLGNERETVYEYVDPDTLDALFEHTRSSEMSLQFEMEAVVVTVWQSDGEVCAYVTDRGPE